MTEAIYPQCRIVPVRFLSPATAETLLNRLIRAGGIRRMSIHGPRIPASVPYGPARGQPNPHADRRIIKVCDQEFELQVQVGTILLELEDESFIPVMREACEEVFTEYSYQFQVGRFMKTQPSITDYAKYGPDADKQILGLCDPNRKEGPIIIQETK
ncbi:MAG: methyl-coenzyme M reductase operon protein D [Methanomicrobiaceae archaeon]|nr:methyl-coenzyme M reductase operon protein D [Methanomicrobiaceae archaeon]